MDPKSFLTMHGMGQYADIFDQSVSDFQNSEYIYLLPTDRYIPKRYIKSNYSYELAPEYNLYKFVPFENEIEVEYFWYMNGKPFKKSIISHQDVSYGKEYIWDKNGMPLMESYTITNTVGDDDDIYKDNDYINNNFKRHRLYDIEFEKHYFDENGNLAYKISATYRRKPFKELDEYKTFDIYQIKNGQVLSHRNLEDLKLAVNNLDVDPDYDPEIPDLGLGFRLDDVVKEIEQQFMDRVR